MKQKSLMLCLIYVAGIVMTGVVSAAPAPAATFVVPTQAPWIKVADNKIHAQTLVNRLMAKYPELVALGLHSVPPGVEAQPNEPGQVIVAQVDDIIGRASGPGDLTIGKLEQVVIYKGALAGVPRMRVYSPLRDREGRNIGLAVMVFKLEATPTPLSAHVRADAILKQLADDLPDQASLFKSSP